MFRLFRARSLEVNPSCTLAGKFLLHQGWLEDDEPVNRTNILILQNKTEDILRQLSFEWPIISYNLLVKYCHNIFS